MARPLASEFMIHPLFSFGCINRILWANLALSVSKACCKASVHFHLFPLRSSTSKGSTYEEKFKMNYWWKLHILKNLRNCRWFLGIGYLKITSLFSRSAFTPSSEIIWPRNLISGLQNWHFAALTVKPALGNLSRTKSMCYRCSVKVSEWISRSSTYTTKLLLRPQSPKTLSRALMNAARLFLKP